MISACAELCAELLKRCPGLRIIATSRQRLRISGETEWRVPPLETPSMSLPANSSKREAALRSNEALALFMDRAQRVRGDLPTDLALCGWRRTSARHLDGIPLALELAAARLQALTVAQLAERLEGRFKLLASGDVTAPSRQQTLRAMLDWSHDLLSDGERTLFRQLAVFAGGWSLEAAESVCSEGADTGPAVLDGLASLVDKSLVLFSDVGGDGRYGMLETVRQYARGKLARSGEEGENCGGGIETFSLQRKMRDSTYRASAAESLDRLEGSMTTCGRHSTIAPTTPPNKYRFEAGRRAPSILGHAGASGGGWQTLCRPIEPGFWVVANSRTCSGAARSRQHRFLPGTSCGRKAAV